MTPQELQLRMKFHEEQANRLLNANPLIAEFYFHLSQVELMKQQLQGHTEKTMPSQERQLKSARDVPVNGSV